MGHFFPDTIGFMAATALFLSLSSTVPVLAQTPEASPVAPQSPTPDPSELVAPSGYQEVTGNDWSFVVPSNWQNLVSEPVDLAEDVSLVAQITDDQKQVAVNLVIQDYKGDNNDYLAQSIETLSTLGTVHTQEPITLSGWQGMALDFSLTSNDPPTRLLQRVVAANGTGYALTCGGREENFATTQSVCTDILNSFQITPP